MSDITIRPAEMGDVEAIFSIRTSVRENHLSREQMAEMGITAETVREIVGTGGSVWIAEAGGVACGFAMIDGDSLFALFIRPEFEGRGLARLLLAEAEAVLFAHHETVWLETAAQSRAAGFYAAHGWTVTETLDGGDVRFEKRR